MDRRYFQNRNFRFICTKRGENFDVQNGNFGGPAPCAFELRELRWDDTVVMTINKGPFRFDELQPFTLWQPTTRTPQRPWNAARYWLIHFPRRKQLHRYRFCICARKQTSTTLRRHFQRIFNVSFSRLHLNASDESIWLFQNRSYDSREKILPRDATQSAVMPQ